MDIRRGIRATLAVMPTLSICGIGGMLAWRLLQTHDVEVPTEDMQTVKELALFVIGGVLGMASTASSYYFKADKDE